MIQQNTADLGRYPQEGSAISIQGESTQALAATVVTSSPAEIWLELARPTSQDLFQEGEEVRIKYWDEEAVVYYWDAEVINITPSGKRHVAISIHNKGVTVQRRKVSSGEYAHSFLVHGHRCCRLETHRQESRRFPNRKYQRKRIVI